ncbi:MAG: GDP-mannose 4,6-dehydratase [Dehalococcoidia bacterium]|nr:GDP-mannose 4,6-dehydratase [Dehalococcoidia bacterium]
MTSWTWTVCVTGFPANRPHARSHTPGGPGQRRESLHEPARYAEVNLLGSINLLEAARRHDRQRIIYASPPARCYGEPLFVPVTEDHPINPLDPYGASKHAVEHYLYLYQHNYGLAYTIRAIPTSGPRQDPLGEAGVIAIFTGAMLADRRSPSTAAASRCVICLRGRHCAAIWPSCKPGSAIYNWETASTSASTLIHFAELQGGHAIPLAPHYGPAKLGEVSHLPGPSQARRDLGWDPDESTTACA